MTVLPGSLPSLLISIPEGVLDLGWGHPSPHLHPTEALQIASERVLSQQSAVPLQYGAVQGFGPLIEGLADFLSSQDAYGNLAVDPKSLFLTAGASQGIDLATTIFARSGDTVFVEEPTYYLIGQIFRDHGLQVVGVPTDHHGLDVDSLELMLQDGHRPRLLYVIPAYQNPTGATLAPERRHRLIRLAQRYGFTILADEVYQLLHYGEPPPPPLATMDDTDDGCVVSLGSFSKILAPGLRLGWVHASPGLIQRFVESGVAASGGGLSHFAAAMAQATLDMGLLQENLANLRRVYATRRDAVAGILSTDLADHVEFHHPYGGYFFWLTLSDGADADALLPVAQKAGVSYRPGTAFSSGGLFRDSLRISFSLYEVGELAEALNRLGQAIRSA